MHMSDMREAFANGHPREIEGAFRALVGYPKEEEIKGIGSASETVAVLKTACEKLASDTSIMPSGTIDFLNDIAALEDGEALAYGATYADGAKLVSERIGAWSQHFAAEIGEGDDA